MTFVTNSAYIEKLKYFPEFRPTTKFEKWGERMEDRKYNSKNKSDKKNWRENKTETCLANASHYGLLWEQLGPRHRGGYWLILSV